MPINIFLLTDGKIENEDKGNKTLKLIEENNNEFKVYSIGIGNDFDSDFIKNSGILGRGNYNFCPDISNLKEIIVNEITKACCSFGHYIKGILDSNEKCIIKLNEEMTYSKQNNYINIKYINEIKEEEDINNKKINLLLKHFNNNQNEELVENIKIKLEKLPKGEELSKLIMNEYLSENNEINLEEKIKLALIYQILTEYTSLFAEIEFSEKVSEELKKVILGDKNNNIIKNKKSKHEEIIEILMKSKEMLKIATKNFKEELNSQKAVFASSYDEEKGEELIKEKEKHLKTNEPSNFFKSIGKSIKGLFSKKNKNEAINNTNIISDNKNEDKKEKNINEVIEINVDEIIKEQNFIEGFWDINKKTEIIKKKYEKEFKLLKDKNYDDRIVLTILIIYFINKEHSELLKELVHIIQKAKNFIKKKSKNSYDNIIQNLNI